MQVEGVAQRSGVGTDCGGQPGEVDGVFDVHDLMVPEIFLRLLRKKSTISRFLSMATLGLKLIPTCGADGGWCGFAHTVYRAWVDVLLICAGRAHWAPPAMIRERVRL